MKPRLNKEIFVLFDNRVISFTKEKVIALGEDIFFHTGALDNCVADEYRRPLYYEDYGKTWFKTLKEIKDKFVDDRHKLVKIDDDYYELERRK